MLFPYYCFAVSRLSSVVGITSSNRILSGINLYLCLQYMDGNAQPLLGETLRGKGGNPHFCYGFRVPPFPLSFIPLTPCRQQDRSQTAHPVEQSYPYIPSRRQSDRYQTAHPKEQSILPTHQSRHPQTPPFYYTFAPITMTKSHREFDIY